MEETTRQAIINKVTGFIEERGLTLSTVEQRDDGFVEVITTEAKIRRIELKPYLEFLGIKDCKVGYDRVTFQPEADFYVFSYNVLSEDPNVKEDDIRKMVAEAINVPESEIEVGPSDVKHDGACVFKFTVTSCKALGEKAEKDYIEFAMPQATKSSTLLGEFFNNLEEQEELATAQNPVGDGNINETVTWFSSHYDPETGKYNSREGDLTPQQEEEGDPTTPSAEPQEESVVIGDVPNHESLRLMSRESLIDLKSRLEGAQESAQELNQTKIYDCKRTS